MPISAGSEEQGFSEVTGVLLRGMGTRFDPFGRPERLAGRRKLEDDLLRITQGYLHHNALLKTTLSPADMGNTAAGIKEVLEDSNNWWVGQLSPITLSDVLITLRSVRPLGGVNLATVDDPSQGNLDIQILYVERSVGLVVDTQTLVIPFGAYALEGGNS